MSICPEVSVIGGRPGGGAAVLTLNTFRGGDVAGGQIESLDLECLDDALNELEQMDPRQAKIVILRCFGGLTIEQVASALDLSPTTVKRERATARIWLHRGLNAENT